MDDGGRMILSGIGILILSGILILKGRIFLSSTIDWVTALDTFTVKSCLQDEKQKKIWGEKPPKKLRNSKLQVQTTRAASSKN